MLRGGRVSDVCLSAGGAAEKDLGRTRHDEMGVLS